MSKALQLIVNEVAQLEQMLIESGGEITPEIENMLAVKDVQLPEKIDGYYSIIERFELIQDFYKQKADAMSRLAKAASQVSDRCKDNLKLAMQELNVDELKGQDYRFKLSPSNPSVIIPDESLLDQSYTITKTVTSIDKKRILEDLKLAVKVMGARLEENFSLRKYLNRSAK